jgi:DnaJ-class molecular chaperone
MTILLSVLVAVTFVCVAVEAGRDFYKILGVPRSADKAAIKKAARKLQLKYHPDKSDAADAEAKFIEVAEALEVLGDDDKRAAYDRFGEDGVKQQHQQHQQQGGFRGASLRATMTSSRFPGKRKTKKNAHFSLFL